jgi:hypothetical protein
MTPFARHSTFVARVRAFSPVIATILAILALVGFGMAISHERETRQAWGRMRESIQKRDALVPNLIYLIKTHPGYPDLEGAATLFQAQKTCEAFELANTLNYASVCIVELERLIRSQQEILAKKLTRSAQRDHWVQLSAVLDAATAQIRRNCREIHEEYRNAPTLTRPWRALLAQHDWSALRVCE